VQWVCAQRQGSLQLPGKRSVIVAPPWIIYGRKPDRAL